MKQTKPSFIAPACILSFFLWFGLWQISNAIRDTKIHISIPQTKTTVQVPNGYAPAKPWPEGVMLPRPEAAR